VPPRLSEAGAQRGWAAGASHLSVAGAVSACLCILYFFDPRQHGFYPPCMFHRLTGLHCPGCGSLRAIHQLLHGHVAAAIHFNALLILALIFMCGRAIHYFVRDQTASSPRPSPPKEEREESSPSATFVPAPVWLWFGLTVAVVFTVLRNLPFAVFGFLRP